MEYIGSKKKQESIVDVLKDEILSGRIPSGTEMTQNELAQELGVSRMPVREALIVLEYQGLILRLPNNHVRTAELTEDYFRHIFRYAADLEMEALLCWQETGELPSDEMEFHRQIRRDYRYSFAGKALETLTETYISFAVRQSGGDGADRIQKVRERLAVGDVETAEKQLREYFDGLVQAMMKARE